MTPNGDGQSLNSRGDRYFNTSGERDSIYTQARRFSRTSSGFCENPLQDPVCTPKGTLSGWPSNWCERVNIYTMSNTTPNWLHSPSPFHYLYTVRDDHSAVRPDSKFCWLLSNATSDNRISQALKDLSSRRMSMASKLPNSRSVTLQLMERYVSRQLEM